MTMFSSYFAVFLFCLSFKVKCLRQTYLMKEKSERKNSMATLQTQTHRAILDIDVNIK